MLQLKKVRNNIVKSKIWIQRSMSWISIINAGMILFLVLAKFQDYGVNIHITKWIIPIYIFAILVMVVVGYFEDKMGFFKEEVREHTNRNPQMQEILERLDRIEKKIK